MSTNKKTTATKKTTKVKNVKTATKKATVKKATVKKVSKLDGVKLVQYPNNEPIEHSHWNIAEGVNNVKLDFVKTIAIQLKETTDGKRYQVKVEAINVTVLGTVKLYRKFRIQNKLTDVLPLKLYYRPIDATVPARVIVDVTGNKDGKHPKNARLVEATKLNICTLFSYHLDNAIKRGLNKKYNALKKTLKPPTPVKSKVKKS